jgi:hypothetical protein
VLEKMSLQGHILLTAQSQLGVVEKGGADGKSGNIVPYWDWWKSCTHENGQGQSWCACFWSWVYAQNKASNLIAAKNAYGFIYCPDLERYAKTHGTIITDKSKAQPADFILFDWNGAGIADHVEAVEKNNSDHFLQTIGANTGAEGALGSQSNGGGVYRRQRHIDATMRMIWRPDFPVKLTSLVSTAK